MFKESTYCFPRPPTFCLPACPPSNFSHHNLKGQKEPAMKHNNLTHKSKTHAPLIQASCSLLSSILTHLSSSVYRSEETQPPDYSVELSCVSINLFNLNPASCNCCLLNSIQLSLYI
ncbi:hypothetical protein ILYODFUR_027948 [Ilyodon furcidens]|uniref:Uncharacterized protein n=1 Tax=Ilyodon furcidens TaxID=33524 RepID=A0ABV0T0T1_9TELE